MSQRDLRIGGSSVAEDAANELPDHLIRLPGSAWTLWRWVALRGAGFPAAQVLALASPECAAAADRIASAERAEQQALEELCAALRAALDATQPDPGQGAVA